MKIQLLTPIHVFDHQDGSKYPYEILRDIRVVVGSRWRVAIPGRLDRPGQTEGYRTDFASIPGRKSLKRWLEPQRLIRSLFDPSIEGVVWVWGGDVLDPVCLGCFRDPVALPSILHDWFYSTQVIGRALADRIFLDGLLQGGVWSAHVMYAAVRMFGGPAFADGDLDEIRKDRDMGSAAMERFYESHPNI